jgi:spermidine synthase
VPTPSLERAAVQALFLLSGFSALAYEVLWERALRLSFGVSTYSVAVVTAAFMAGLSLGYALGRSPRLARFRALRVYAAAEAAVAVYALAFPAVHAAVDAAYVASGGSIAVRAVLAFAALLPPTILMGLTLPVVARALSTGGTAGQAAAGLFAANTTGGVVGTLATAWYLIRWFGAATSAGVAVAVNLAAALGALALASRGRAEPAIETSPVPARARAGRVAFALGVAAFLAGFQTMALQVVWNRTLVCVVENNTTSFSLILASVLLGSAVGAWLYASIARRIVSHGGRLRLFVAVEIFLCVYVAASIPLLNRLYDVARALSDVIVIDGPADLLLVRLLVAILPVGPAAAAGAFLLPLLVDLLRSEADEDAAPAVSTVFAADSIGSVAGALTAGFGLIPGIGIGRSLVAMGLLAAVTAVIVLVVLRRNFRELVLGAAPLAGAAVIALVVAEPLTLTRWYDGHEGR